MNNVIWRFLSGKRTGQRDKQTKELTQNVVKVIRAAVPDTLLSILQVKSGIIFKAMRSVDTKHSLF